MSCYYKLKPCPFCGGSAVFRIHSLISNNQSIGYDYSIECSNCGCTPFSKSTRMEIRMSEKDGSIFPTGESQVRQEKLVKDWNTRTQNDFKE